MRLLLVTTLFCFFFGQDALNQKRAVVQTEFYSVEQGLASREVFCGVHDKQGFLWFGTRNGLNRFDGKQFKLLTHQNAGLAQNRIYHLVCDNQNRLYILYGNNGLANGVVGVNMMDVSTGKIQSLKDVYPQLPFDDRTIYWINKSGNDIVFMTSSPFTLWVLHEGKFTRRFVFKDWTNWTRTEDKPQSSQGAYYTTTGRHCTFKGNSYAVFISDEHPYYFLTPNGDYEIHPERGTGIIKIISDREVLFRNKTNISSFHLDKQPDPELEKIKAG